ncbi:metallo-dependent phosphatase-like protein [Brevundimonas phage vB_BpoS-Kabachok]|uniref:Metallo-dependent phosphatase-like protein n=1 Tax=Brevundimonas phage vB_BpoS-Kabachok TaxID=2948600 RepID=A0A9E7MR86_9CAUD|nr:metallo-dependent phosphatase-like protein [Brevundimonas phage vB_BpoS-Kabachok]
METEWSKAEMEFTVAAAADMQADIEAGLARRTPGRRPLRALILSDLHLEFGGMDRRTWTAPTADEIDVVIAAGDLATGVVGVIWLARHFPDVPCLYVPGNHEFYGKRRYHRHIEKMKAKADELAPACVFVMDNEQVHVGDVRFLGSTLWTDFDLYGTWPLSIRHAQSDMNDYQQIELKQQQRLTAEDTRRLHLESRFFLTETLRVPHDGPTVVISHHAPSEQSSHPRYRGSLLNPAYASRLEPLMLEWEPALWVHGHMHDSSDYQIGETRVICNPRGYVGHELNPNFNPRLIVTL